MTELAENAFDKKGARPPNLIGQYAGFFSRALALLVDTVIIFLVIFALPAMVNGIFRSLGLGGLLDITNIFNKLGNFFGSGVIASFILLCLISYFLFFWYFTGQTLGDNLMGVRIVRTSGHRLGLLRGILRLIGYIISIIPLGLGFLWVLGDDHRQGWHDKLADTYVIYAWEARPNEHFLSDSTRNRFSARLRVHTQLSPEDYESPINQTANLTLNSDKT
jgi:uncharacterized RDD family membrane protein YckC